MRKTELSLIVLSLLALSCSRPESMGRQTIPYVREVIAGEHPGVRTLLERNAVPEKKSSIFIIGERGECEKIAGELLYCDRHDNVDGSLRQDLLPDFAGETIVPLIDVANTPYYGYLEWRNEDFFRELTVKSVISAVDSACYLSPYDRLGIAGKRFPKLIVLASSYAAEYGLFDVDSLFSACGCGIHIVNPLNEMMDRAVERGAANIGVMTSPEKISSGIYSSVFQRKARENGMDKPECVAFASKSDSSVFALVQWLDQYIAAGFKRPLDAILIDDLRLFPDGIDKAVKAVRSVHNEASLKYSEFFADDFEILDARSVTAQKCYRILREHNLFTHYISYPDRESYLFVPFFGLQHASYDEKGFFTDEFKYSRASAARDSSFILIQYNDRYIP